MKIDRHKVKEIKRVYPLLSNSIIQRLLDLNAIDIARLDIDILREVLFNSSYYPNTPIQKDITIVYEDIDTLVINKESDVVIEDLVSYATWYINKYSHNPMDVPRPVHRLDKDTH